MQRSFLDQISTTAIEQIPPEMYFISLKIASKKSWLYSFPSALRKKKKKEESPTREEQHVTDINIRA